MNSDITFECENVVFNFRVATVIKNGDKILVQKDNRVSHVTLPGGRCSLGEDTTETSVREFKEETGINCLFVKSLGMIENFFVSSFNGKKYHEILMINEIKFVDHNLYSMKEIPNIEEKKKEHLKFIWMTQEELKNSNFKPEIILEIINNDGFTHLINKD